MLALVASPSHLDLAVLAEVPEPVAGRGQVLVEVRHAALNRGDLNDVRSGRIRDGEVLGSDLAGVVVRAAAGGVGPPVGTRVVALAASAFAPLVAVAPENLAIVPDDVRLDAASALPVAGVAARQALGRAGAEAGSRVLVTGASGGVGLYAVQLAAALGASVTGLVSREHGVDAVTRAGAVGVIVGVDGLRDVDRFEVVVETVGGGVLVAAWRALEPGGSIQSVGWASGADAVFPAYATIGPAKALESFIIEPPVADDLAALVAHLRRGELEVAIGWQGPMTAHPRAFAALEARSVVGKVVFDLAAGRARG